MDSGGFPKRIEPHTNLSLLGEYRRQVADLERKLEDAPESSKKDRRKDRLLRFKEVLIPRVEAAIARGEGEEVVAKPPRIRTTRVAYRRPCW